MGQVGYSEEPQLLEESTENIVDEIKEETKEETINE